MKNFNLVSPLALVTVLLISSFGPAAEASAPPPFVVKDINTGGASAPAELVTMGGVTFFAADDGVNGMELWKSDGTAAGTVMVKDICAGACDGYPYQLTVADVPGGERLFFGANTASNGYELWKSDGTAAGTVQVKDIYAGANSSGVYLLTAVGNQLFFRANDYDSGTELWKSDGTTAGTQLVKDITPGTNSMPADLTAVGNTLFFTSLSNLGREVWKSDGTEAGTVLVKDINPGGGSSLPIRLTAVGNTLFFAAYTGSGYELWKSDGTAVGTSSVKNINPGFASSDPNHLTALGNLLFFTANDGTSGTELWKSDGTLAGTVRVRDINPGSSASQPAHLTVAQDLLYFSADNGADGFELWKSNGTYGGTVLVKDINPGAAGSNPDQFAAAGSHVYFSADDGSLGRELWSSDGTDPGTQFWNLNAESAPSTPTEPTEATGLLFFAADDGLVGRELWAFQFGGPVLGLSKVFTEGVVEAGTSSHTFTLTVDNSGSAAATSVRITDPVDARLAVSSVSPAAKCTASSGQFVDCTFDTLDPAAVETVTVTYSVPSGAALGPVLNVAQAGEFGGPTIDASDTVEIVGPCEGDNHLDITEDIYGTYLAEACVSISAGPAVHVMPGAVATLSAGSSVVLNNDFVVEAGASLTINTN